MSEKIHLTALTAIVTCLLSLGADDASAQTAGAPAEATLADNAPQLPWPAQIAAGDSRFLVYQPQFEKWEGDRIDGRAAVSIQGQDGEADGFGMIWLSARTTTDPAGGTVTIRDIALSRAEFPTAEARSADYLRMLRQQLAAKSWRVPLERLRADLQIERATRSASAQPLSNDAPEIIYSDRPAILVPVDGEPVLRNLAGTSLQRVINTRALLVRDNAAERFYLYLTGRWLSARSLTGPWTVAADSRDDLGEALRIAGEEGDVDLLDDEDGGAAARPAVIHVSTSPAELLQTDGPPDYAPVEGTRLLHVTNSPNSIFMDLRTQQHYALISGRWYRARSLRDRGWEYVSATALPADFAMIPEDHATAGVRAAVPGTPQAREAAIANEVPQIAAVTRSAAGLEISYDGDAAFDPIPGTALYRAVNAPIPVIRVADNIFYALDSGIWFVASSPYGPWAVATYVPPAVYAIPRSSPLHYVTYVRIYDATPEVVYVGYTPGYLGSYISSDHVVVYGTGWYYQPWIGSVWYASPVTWGFGFSIVHSWWYPWRPVLSVSWGWPYYRPYYRPYWGPWHHRAAHHHGHDSHRQRTQVNVINNITIDRSHTDVTNIYGRWDRKAVASHRQGLRAPDRRAPIHADRLRTNPRPGTGYIERSDGRRQFIDGRVESPHADARRADGRNDRRDWQNRDDERRNRAGLPPVQRSDQARRDFNRRDMTPGNPVRRDAGVRGRGDQPQFEQHDGRREQARERERDSVRDRADLPQIQTPRRSAEVSAVPARPARELRGEARSTGQAPFAVRQPRMRDDPERQAAREQNQPRQPSPESRPNRDSRPEVRPAPPQAIERQVGRPAPVVQPAPVAGMPERRHAEARPQMPRAEGPAVERRPPVQRSESGGWIQRGVERQQMQGAQAPRQVQGAQAPRQIQGAQAGGNERRAPRSGGQSDMSFGERR